MDSPLLFLATALAILAAPGPTNALFAMSGALHGVRRSLVLIPAGAAGYLIAVTLLGLALGPALAASPAAARILRLLIGAYLFVLAFRLWRKGSATDGRAAAAVGAREVFVATLLGARFTDLAAIAKSGDWFSALFFGRGESSQGSDDDQWPLCANSGHVWTAPRGHVWTYMDPARLQRV
jgi:threonine/homoserine/homoserine lactone efflux protein